LVLMSDVWDRTTEFLSDNLGSVTPVAILTVFVPVSVQSSITGATASLSPGDPGLIGYQLVSLLMSLVLLYGGLAIAALATDAAIGAGPALGLAARRFPLALLVAIVLFAGLLVLLTPFLALVDLRQVAMMGGQFTAASNINPAVALGLALYGFVVALALLWVGARLAVTNPTIVAEGRGLSALPRAWRLTRGHGFKIIGVAILYGVTYFVATRATAWALGSLLRLLTGDDGALSIATVMTGVITGAVATAFVVLAGAFIAKLYLALGGAASARAGLN
jgi:hypothetical protein